MPVDPVASKIQERCSRYHRPIPRQRGGRAAPPPSRGHADRPLRRCRDRGVHFGRDRAGHRRDPDHLVRPSRRHLCPSGRPCPSCPSHHLSYQNHHHRSYRTFWERRLTARRNHSDVGIWHAKRGRTRAKKRNRQQASNRRATQRQSDCRTGCQRIAPGLRLIEQHYVLHNARNELTASPSGLLPRISSVIG